jgi:nitroimidazol reductase NimA-like FMN-containing flavoprotein (pyridoxamine 5'-phosphate oxidase superfamily)
MADTVNSFPLIICIECPKVLHFHEGENDKQQEVTIFMENSLRTMRKAKQEITNQEELEEILKAALICRVAMMDGERPYILPFNYGFSEGCLYIHSAPEGKKMDLLVRNPEVCFEVEDSTEITTGEKACDWSTRYRSVVGYGRVEILSDEKSKQQGLEVIMARHGAPELIEFNPGNMKRMVILKLTIRIMTGKKSSNWNQDSH